MAVCPMGRPRSVAPVEATSGLGLLFFFSELGLLQSPVMEPMAGIEPATDGLRNRCSTAELHWRPDHNRPRSQRMLGGLQTAFLIARTEAKGKRGEMGDE
jgi:hypothetical protein